MNENLLDSSLCRRDFLAGVAGVGVAATLPIHKICFRADTAAETRISISFWAGSGFVDAQRLASGNQSLKGSLLRVTVQSTGEGPLRSLDMHGFKPPEGSDENSSFKAWATPPEGCANVSFLVRADKALTLSLFQELNTGEITEIPIAFNIGEQPGPKLREGVYVIVPGNSDFEGFLFSRDCGAPRLESTYAASPAQFLTITVERAN